MMSDVWNFDKSHHYKSFEFFENLQTFAQSDPSAYLQPASLGVMATGVESGDFCTYICWSEKLEK